MSRARRVLKWILLGIGGVLLLVLGLALALVLWVVARPPHEPPQWRRAFDVSARVADFPAVEVSDPDRFLNDLKLSPMWRVGSDKSGTPIAEPLRMRNVERPVRDGSSCRFLFEMRSIHPQRGGTDGPCQLGVTVEFRPPEDFFDLALPAQDVTLGVHELMFGTDIWSTGSKLAVKLSREADVYLVLNESGDDRTRSQTFAELPRVMRELADLAASTTDYRVERRYAELFERLFQQPLQHSELKRLPGGQGVDDFHGFLRTRPGTSYEGVNLGVFSPTYCTDEKGECTRSYERIRKAEDLGAPHQPGDVVFFYFPHTMVFTPYDDEFGWFSGNRSFDAAIRITNRAGQVLLETTGPFRGWER